MATGQAPVLETALEMTAASLEHTELDAATLILVRLAALVAVDAPPASYLMHFGPGADAGLTLADAQDVLVGVAPIVGTARTLSAAAAIADALGFAIAVSAEEAAAENA